MENINIRVLGYEGPILRAYLAAMHLSGYKADVLDIMLPAKKNILSRVLPKNVITNYQLSILDNSRNYWMKYLYKNYSDYVKLSVKHYEEFFNLPSGFLPVLLERNDYSKYADSVNFLNVDNLKDTALLEHLRSNAPTVVLFTGGGIVPKQFFEIDGLRIIHIHPGYLPHTRGADGLLWSILTRNKIGASSFYMSAGLDTGDIIKAMEFDLNAIDAKCPLKKDIMLYRFIFSFIDPLLRARLLLETIKMAKSNTELQAIPSYTQAEEDGSTFHFMHPELRKIAYKKLLNISPSEIQ